MVDRIVKNKFRILKKLGQGGMGAVYLAEQVGIGHKVALKFLKAEFSSDAEIARRFLNEAKSYARVAHPNAVALHDFGQDEEGNLFIAMEYCEGTDLKKVIAEKPLAMIESIDVVLQVADVLANAHEKGVVHRDLKPENIMVRRGLRGLHAKVLDFGIARLMDASTRLTVAGAIAGTPRYMSPEQVEGREVDLRADIYSLGIVLFELLTGRQPFDGSTIAEILRRQAVEPMPHLTEYVPELDYPDLDAVIQKACRKRREERWPDMLAFASALSMATPTQADLGLTPLQRSSVHKIQATPRPTVQDITPASTSGVAVPGQAVEPSSSDHTRLKPLTVVPLSRPFRPEGEQPELQEENQLVTDLTGPRQHATNAGVVEGAPGELEEEAEPLKVPTSKAPLIAASIVVVLIAGGIGVYALRSSPDTGGQTVGPAKPTEPAKPTTEPVKPTTEPVKPTEPAKATDSTNETAQVSASAEKNPDSNILPAVRREVREAIVEGTINSFYGQGVAQFDAANFDAAESFLEKVPESSEYSARALELRKKIKTIRETLAQANQERYRGNLGKAIRLYDEVLRLNPQVKAAKEGRAIAQESTINPIMQ